MSDFKKTIDLIRNHPVMDKAEVTQSDKESLVELLKANNLLDLAQDIEEMELADFEDFLVNQCGDD